MKKLLFLSLLFLPVLILCSSCSGQTEMDKFIDELMSEMTLREKLGQMHLPTGGDLVSGTVKNEQLEGSIKNGEIGGFFNVKGAAKIKELQRLAVEESRLGIPLLVGADVIHGYETMFPIPLALSCTWDTLAVERMARISAVEASADGVNWTYSPMVDICRDARWGRIAEGAGEDPYLGAKMAKAYVRGYQGDLRDSDEILACVKHFALYGAVEAGRDYNTVDMSRVRMYNEYFAPYKAAVEAGVATVMTSFNLVNGVHATADRWLVTDVLREQWGFDGMVVTDYNSINEMDKHGLAGQKDAAVQALLAGTDMDMVSGGFLNTLEESLEAGLISRRDIDNACRRVLEAKYKLGLFEDPYKYCDIERPSKDIFTGEHRAAAREIAAETFVLLKNENHVLPLKSCRRIALVGPLADARNNMCGTWSMSCDTEEHSSLLEGLKKVPDCRVDYFKGSNLYHDKEVQRRACGQRGIEYSEDLGISESALIGADVIIAAVGEAAEMSGESASRADIRIPDAQRGLLGKLAKISKRHNIPLVLVTFSGRPLDLSEESEYADAILHVWFGGSEAGDAMADVLTGRVNPSGRLTMSFPRAVGQLPLAYNHLNTGRPDRNDSKFNRYASNYIDCPNTPLYPFGYGLTYTSFEYGEISLSGDTLPKGGELTASVTVSNTGDCDGYEVVQLYLRDMYASIARPVRELKGYQRIYLKKGESVEVKFTVSAEELKFYNSELEYDYEPGEFQLMIGGNSRDVQKVDFVAE